MKTNLLIVALVVLPLFALSQSPRLIKVGFGLDGISYIGDLSDPDVAIHRIYPGANLSIQVEGPKRLKLQLNGGFGKFAEQYDGVKPSTDPTIRVNTFVETSFYYGDLRLKYRFPVSPYFQPYLTAGAGVLVFEPRDETGRRLQGATFTREPGEEYSKAIPQLPVGAGFQTRLNKSLSMSLEYLFRYTPTDYLDNIGNLGNRSGHDFLHGLQLSLYITLSPPDDPAYQAAPYANEVDSLSTTEAEAVAEQIDSTGTETPLKPVQPEVENADTPSPVSDEDWLSKEEAALANNQFIFYKVKKKDSLEALSQLYKVRIETLKEVNFLTGDTLQKGTILRIPDTGAVNQ